MKEFNVVLVIVIIIYTALIIFSAWIIGLQKKEIKLKNEMILNYRDLDRLKDKRYSKMLISQGKLLTCLEMLKQKEPTK